MTGAELLPWLCLAVAGLGFLALVMSWITAKASDAMFLFYVLLTLVGFFGWLATR